MNQVICGGSSEPQGVTETELQGDDAIQVGDFVIDVSGDRVWIRGVKAQVTPQEFTT